VKVLLLQCTPDPERMVALAARLCYSPSGIGELREDVSRKDVRDLVRKVLAMGHTSTLEHVTFTFGVEGISRAASHQLVRHRIASYSQQSQRYPSVLENEEAHDLFIKQTRDAWSCYEQLVSLGIPKEDARFILPHGTETRLVMTMNARELHHFFSLRLCKRAQWEIRELARKMLMLARNAAPDIFDLAGPSCVVEGICKEAHSCGEPYVSMEKMLSE